MKNDSSETELAVVRLRAIRLLGELDEESLLLVAGFVDRVAPQTAKTRRRGPKPRISSDKESPS